MFARLNQIIGLDPAGDSAADPSFPGGRPATFTHGFQVLRNRNAAVPIDPWFDFIVQLAGRPLRGPADADEIAQELANNPGGSVPLTVWSAKGGRVRTVFVPVPVPAAAAAAAAGAASPGRPATADPVGLALQWGPLASTDFVWHVLEVSPESPADLGGLIPHSDYIIDSPNGLVQRPSALEDLVNNFQDRPLTLHVYNREYDVVRPVTITPSTGWGGPGRLGCSLGFGSMHRIPVPLAEPPQAPGETLFASTESPAAPAQPSPSSAIPHGAPPPPPQQQQQQQQPDGPAAAVVPAQPRPSRPRRQRPAGDKSSALDDLMAAEGEKSRQVDGRFRKTTPAPDGMEPPPPPKAAAGLAGPPGSGPLKPSTPAPAGAGEDGPPPPRPRSAATPPGQEEGSQEEPEQGE